MDLLLAITPQGGDLVYLGNDLVYTDGLENFVVLSLFGGNLEASTPPERLAGELDFSYWANTVLWPNEPDKQMNSDTERTLRNTPLNSAAITTIQRAVNNDLAWMAEFAQVAVTVSIPYVDTVNINIVVARPNGLPQQFQLIWNATIQTLSGPPTTRTPPATRLATPGLDHTLNHYFG